MIVGGWKTEEVRVVFFFKQKTAYEVVSRDWSSDVCSSDLLVAVLAFFSNSFFSGVTTRFVERPTLNSEGSHSGKFVLMLLAKP